MSDPFPNPDSDKVLDALQQRAVADAITPSHRGRNWLLAAGALAASILLIVFLLIPRSAIQASPREVVERAKDVHQIPTDRCYSVRAEVPADVRARFPRFDFDGESKLWTRGNRYFVELPNGNGVWGRDEQNRVWFAPLADAAARFDDDEVPTVFREFLNVRAVRLDELLDEVLAECDLTWSTNAEVPNDVRRVNAIGRDDGRSLRHAVIDVDKETNIVRRLALDRQLFRDPRAKISVVFTLVDTTAQDIPRYSPEGHLKPGAPIFDRDRPAMRMGLLTRHVGPFKQD